MDTLLQGIPNVKPYLDDILMSGLTENENDGRLDQVLKMLWTKGLRLKETCCFAAKEMEFPGFRVAEEGVQAAEGKLKAIEEAPPPKNLKQPEAFLGLQNFYSAFCQRKLPCWNRCVAFLTPEHHLVGF
ncbi:hypothetical protein D918_09372 [Trichuris suis]|nr:hypothetical protein D918_09372 [Trichuris suis]